jgi:hypothetical protein
MRDSKNLFLFYVLIKKLKVDNIFVNLEHLKRF